MRRCFVRLPLVLIICLLAVSAFQSSPINASTKGSNWPQWRGPAGQGVSEEKNLPTEWSSTKNIQWKTPIAGRGHSSPIVWDNRIFLTTSLEGEVVQGAKAVEHMDEGKPWRHPDSLGGDRNHIFKVLCLDSESGKLLWEKTAYQGRVFDDRHKKSSYAAPTPATDGRYVYAWFGSEGLYCYDFKGNQIWKQSFGPIATMGMGTGTSPVLSDNLVILQCDEDAGEKSFIVAVDKKTGKQVWKVSRKVQASWSTPVLIKTAQRTELVTNGNEWIISYDPATGKELWKCKGVESNAIHTPLVGHNMVFVTAGYPAKRTFAIRLGGSGDITGTPNIAWKYEKGTAYVASPILYGDYIYLISDKGILTCLDARTGELKYEGGRVPVPATFMSSPVAFDGKLLMSSEDGDTFIVKAGPAHEVVRTNSIGEPIYSTPALAGGKIFIRGEKHLYCISNGAGR
jgi:outer membrane protein assembly factor BamB